MSALLLSAGCAGDGRSKSDDPLAGGGPSIPLRTEPVAGATPARGAEAAATTGMPRTSVPVLPVPSSATSNAALAGGAFQPLDPTRDLRIGNGDGSSSATGRGPADGAKTTPNPPQPAPGEPAALAAGFTRPRPAANAAGSPTAPLSVGNSLGASADALLALLQARGVSWQRLENTGDSAEWKYICSVPNPNNPNIRRTYEARDRDPRSAMAAVLTQMDQERR